MMRVLAIYSGFRKLKPNEWGPTLVTFHDVTDTTGFMSNGDACAVHYLTFEDREAFDRYVEKESREIKVRLSV